MGCFENTGVGGKGFDLSSKRPTGLFFHLSIIYKSTELEGETKTGRVRVFFGGLSFLFLYIKGETYDQTKT